MISPWSTMLAMSLLRIILFLVRTLLKILLCLEPIGDWKFWNEIYHHFSSTINSFLWAADQKRDSLWHCFLPTNSNFQTQKLLTPTQSMMMTNYCSKDINCNSKNNYSSEDTKCSKDWGFESNFCMLIREKTYLIPKYSRKLKKDSIKTMDSPSSQ